MPEKTLILAGTARVVVPIARSLARRGISVVRAIIGPGFVALGSNAIRKEIDLSGLADENERLAGIAGLIRGEEIDYIMAGDDSALMFVAEHYERLSSLALVAAPPAAIVYGILDKERTLRAAAECGVEAPRSFRFESREEFSQSATSLPFPLVAKPFSKEVDAAFKIRYYRDRKGLEREYASDPDFGRKYLLQEYAPGEGYGIEILMDGGNPSLVFAHRRLKEYPIGGGVSVIAEAVDPPAALVDRALRLLRHIGWNGVAMVEFRWDSKAERAALMEINGRFWGSHALSQACGVDFPYAAWRIAHHLPAEPQIPHRAGTRGRWTAGVFLRLQEALHPSADGVPRPGFARELCTAAAAFRPGVRDMLWSWRDPVPALDELRRVLAAIAAGEARRLLRWCMPARLMEWRRASRALDPPARRIYLRRRLRDAVRRREASLPRRIQSILFVCHGNIIRSPMAEHLFRSRSRAAIAAKSAGLDAVLGRSADERASLVAREFGVSLDGHRATPVTRDLLAESDLVLVMDRYNEARMLHRFPESAAKVVMLGTFAPQPLPGDEIPDPYLLDEHAIRTCYGTLARCIDRLADRLEASARSC